MEIEDKLDKEVKLADLLTEHKFASSLIAAV